jgi:hypothetical protein
LWNTLALDCLRIAAAIRDGRLSWQQENSNGQFGTK